MDTMGKNAFIITAYTDLDVLCDLVLIYSKYVNCYIHIDKKTDVPKNILMKLTSIPNVCVIHKYKINWGSYLHFMEIIDLLKLALVDGCSYFSIISANTVPIKSLSYVVNFFTLHNDKLFLGYVENDEKTLYSHFEMRYEAFFFQFLYNLRGNKISRCIAKFYEKYLTIPQRMFHLRKKFRINLKYKGYIYCHLNVGAVEYVFKFINKNSDYIDFIKYCYVGEEFFFQNILLNSPYKNNIINDTLIYDIWNPKRGFPAILTENDLPSIINSNKLFARKVNDIKLFNTILEER